MAIILGGGGGGSPSFPTIFLHNSQTWVPPQDGNIMIHLIGAGGSGSGTANAAELESGAAGAYCRKNSLAVTTSHSYTVIIGAGGAGTLGVEGAGVAGGTTSVSGTGLPAGTPLRAFGGAGGALSNNTYTTGGVATGGDVMHDGGRGGYERGGGAVGLLGTGNDGLTSTLASKASRGGSCDIIGNFYSSTLGQLSGAVGGDGTTLQSNPYANSGYNENPKAGPLAGGGSLWTTIADVQRQMDATIGGGGGWIYAQAKSSYSGGGGEGCVVIQYIP